MTWSWLWRWWLRYEWRHDLLGLVPRKRGEVLHWDGGFAYKSRTIYMYNVQETFADPWWNVVEHWQANDTIWVKYRRKTSPSWNRKPPRPLKSWPVRVVTFSSSQVWEYMDGFKYVSFLVIEQQKKGLIFISSFTYFKKLAHKATKETYNSSFEFMLHGLYFVAVTVCWLESRFLLVSGYYSLLRQRNFMDLWYNRFLKKK